MTLTESQRKYIKEILLFKGAIPEKLELADDEELEKCLSLFVEMNYALKEFLDEDLR